MLCSVACVDSIPGQRHTGLPFTCTGLDYQRWTAHMSATVHATVWTCTAAGGNLMLAGRQTGGFQPRLINLQGHWLQQA